MTTTQIYWNKSLNCCMTRLWYISNEDGKSKQRMKEVITDNKTAQQWLSKHSTN